jgi:hypothetical protein
MLDYATQCDQAMIPIIPYKLHLASQKLSKDNGKKADISSIS